MTCLSFGLVAGQRGWLSRVDSTVAWTGEQPQLAELTGVTLATRPDAVVLATGDVTRGDAAERLAAEKPQSELSTVSGILLEASPVTVDAVQPRLRRDELTRRDQEQSMQDGIVAADPHHAAAVSDPENDPRDNVTELLWGARDSTLPKSLMDLASPSALLHGAAEHETCSDHKLTALGTALKWADKPADAYRMAADEQKLVFLIHVSGNFEIPGYT